MACEASRTASTGKLVAISVLAILAIVVLDILLVPIEHVAACSVVFSSAVVIVLVLLARDVRASCDDLDG